MTPWNRLRPEGTSSVPQTPQPDPSGVRSVREGKRDPTKRLTGTLKVSVDTSPFTDVGPSEWEGESDGTCVCSCTGTNLRIPKNDILWFLTPTMSPSPLLLTRPPGDQTQLSLIPWEELPSHPIWGVTKSRDRTESVSKKKIIHEAQNFPKTVGLKLYLLLHKEIEFF